MKLRRAIFASVLLLIAAFVAVVFTSLQLRRVESGKRSVRVEVRPSTIVADGWDETVLSVERPGGLDAAPRVEAAGGGRGATIQDVETTPSHWLFRVRAGVLPGVVTLRVTVAGFAPAAAKLRLELAEADSVSDGTPDFLRLDDERDREAFRRWFTFLVEEQYFHPAASRVAEIDDCAALVRYAYREALHAHDGNWPAASHLLLVPAMDPVRKYSYPYTPLGSDLFRLRTGAFQASDLGGGTFGQFADAETIQRFNTYRVGRDLSCALPGDLLFFRRDAGHMPYHTMVVIGHSQISRATESYVVYHTGPDGKNAGEIRRLTISELLNYPDPQWRPISSSPNFLGVYRWNILHESS